MSREEDEKVAEVLFSWKWMSFVGIPIKGTPEYPNKMRVRQFFPPGSLIDRLWVRHFEESAGEQATGDEPLSYAYCSSAGPAYVPPYTSDAAADYQVLQRIRETFDEPQCNEFIEELNEILEQRANAFPKFQPRGAFARFDLRGLMYEPGDYARAYLQWRKVYAKEMPASS